MTSEISTRQIAMRLVAGIAVMSVVFFGSGGTLAWSGVSFYMIFQYLFSTMLARWLKKQNPDLLRDRMAFLQPTAKGWDKVILLMADKRRGAKWRNEY